jgi:SAM-dependent methyltransferase
MASRPQECAWCAHPFGGSERRLPGGIGCPVCGAATTDPQPSDAELDAAYSRWYRPPGGRFSNPGDRLLARSRGTLARRIARLAPPGRILDVGAGDGALVAALRRRGRDAIGLEREPATEHVVGGQLRDLDGRFAAIIFWHSLEHLRDAGRALSEAAALLDRDGVLVIAMPNPASLQARAFGRRWLALDLPRHLVHVPAPALIERLSALDLDVQRLSYLRGGQVVFGWLHGMVASLPGRPDLYDALRRPAARNREMSAATRIFAIGAGAALAPVALAATAVEVASRRGGTTYVEARRF